MNNRYESQQRHQQLLSIVDRGTAEQLFIFLQNFHRRPFRNLTDVMSYNGVIDDQIDFIDCTGTRYHVTPLIIAAGKGSYEKVKILLVHGANPNKQCITGDTALNLAVHRQKYPIVELLIQYHANPNVYNQSGKTALHRAAVSYTDENISYIQTLLNAGADSTIEDRNQRIPLDEAVIANKPKIVEALLCHDRTLVQRTYRAAVIASRLGYDKCLKKLLDYGMNPNITDRTHTTPLHVAIRSLQLSTARLLIAHGANQNMANNRGETPLSIAELLPADQQQNFTNVLIATPSSKLHTYIIDNARANIYPLLRSHPNWTLDNDKFRSRTAENSSVQNLLDISTEKYWHCTQSTNAWIIFDLKHQYQINGIRIIGCDHHSMPKNGQLDVSNAFNGPWLKIKNFTCLLSQGNMNDFFFSSLKTRFIRISILDNYGGDDIRIQGIAFFGVDMYLVNLLREYRLDNSLNTLLANGINDQETLDAHRDEILNSSDKYLHVNDHFQFIHLTESLRSPQLTFLEWFNPPQTTVIAGDKLQTFSVTADEGVTDRVQLEEKLETCSEATIILMKDLEPIQGRSLVDFSDYIIKSPGRYTIRIVSVESPDIHTPWQEIIVGSTLFYSSKLNTETDEYLYLAPTIRLFNATTSDKENISESLNKLTTTLNKKDNRAFITKVYESEDDDSEDDTYLTSLKSFEDSPYYFSQTNMLRTTVDSHMDDAQQHRDPHDHFIPTNRKEYYDHKTTTVEDASDDSSRSYSRSRQDKFLTPTKYRLQQQRKELNRQEDLTHSQQQSYIPNKHKNGLQRQPSENLNGTKRQTSSSHPPSHSQYDQLESSKNRNDYERQASSPPQVDSGAGRSQSYYESQSSKRKPSQPQSHQQPEIHHQGQYVGQSSSPPRVDSEAERLQSQQQSQIHHQGQYVGQSSSPPQVDSGAGRSQSHYESQSSKRKPSEPRTPTLQHQQQQLSSENIDEDHSIPLLDRYDIKSGTFEVRKNTSDNSLRTYDPKDAQMQLTVKAILQGADVQERARSSMQEIINNKQDNLSKPPMFSNHSSSNNINHPDTNTITTGSKRENQAQIESGRGPRLNSNSNTAFLPTTNNPNSYSTASDHQHGSQTPKPNIFSSSNEITTNVKDYTEEGSRGQYRLFPQVHTTSNYDKNDLTHTTNTHNSSLLSPTQSPTRPSQQKTKYFFGKYVKNQSQDDDNDTNNDDDDDDDDDNNEAECETFGHNSQSGPFTNTNKNNNRNYPPTTNLDDSYNDNNSNIPRFTTQSEFATTTDDIPGQSKQHPRNTQQSAGSYDDDYDNNNNYNNNIYSNDIDNNDDGSEDNGQYSRSVPFSAIEGLVKPNPLNQTSNTTESSQFGSKFHDPRPSQPTNTIEKKGKKPREITVRTTERPHLYTPGIIPPRPHSTPTTDITDEITEKESFNKPYTFRHIPDLYQHSLRNNNKEDKQHSDPMSGVRPPNRLAKARSESKLVNHGTQSEGKLTRNIGTMCESINRKNFGNGPRSQTSKHHSRSSTSMARPYVPSSTSRSPSPSPGPQIYQPSTIPPSKHHSASSKDSRRSHPSKQPPRTTTTETDTSLDGMRPQNHQGVQSEPKSKKDAGTSISAGSKPTSQIMHPINSDTHLSPSPYQPSNSSLSKYQDGYILLRSDPPSSRKKSYERQLTPMNGHVSNYEEKPSKINGSLSSDYNPDDTNSKIYSIKPTTTNHYQHKTPPYHQPKDKEAEPIILTSPIKVVKNDYTKELPNNDPTPIPSPIVIREASTQLPLHYGQQQQTPSINDSPLLNIGTENFIGQSPINEYTTPLKPNYVHQPNRDFTVHNNINSSISKRNEPRTKIFLLPVINSSRTYVFEKQSPPDKNIHQSRINGNFLLTTSPTLRSLNSSHQGTTDSGFDPFTQVKDSDDFTGQHFNSQVA